MRGNYESDSRTQPPAEAPVLYRENGEELELPTVWAVCPVCRGNGTHVNPSIDCDGISGEQFAEDPEFAEAYFSGRYDETCRRCNGRTTVPEVDWDVLEPNIAEEYRSQLEEESADREVWLAEIRAGA